MPSLFEINLFAQSANYPMWAAAILEKLSEECWSAPSSHTRTLAEIENSFNEQVKEAMEDKQFILSDPDCAEYKRAAANPDEHPWGDDVVKLCQKWLAEKSSPAAVWDFVDRIHLSATEQLTEDLPTLTLGEGGDYFAKAIKRMFESEIKNIKLLVPEDPK